jgi:hypothetical protein
LQGTKACVIDFFEHTTSTTQMVQRLSVLRRPARGRGNVTSKNVDPRDLIETATERELEKFLRPLAPASMADIVHKLVGAGYTNAQSLRALDIGQCVESGIEGIDAERLLLAAWLDGVGLVQYVGPLVEHGCDTLLKLLAASDANLKKAGVSAIGHRRQLQRFVREDHHLQERAAAARMAVEAQSSKQRRGLYAGSGGGASSAARQQAAAAGKNSKAAAAAAAPSESQMQQQQQRNLLSRFGPSEDHVNRALTAGLARGGDDAAGGVAPSSAKHVDAWHMPWRTTADAALVNGAGPGERVEAHAPAMTPRDGLMLVRNDGSVMRIW